MILSHTNILSRRSNSRNKISFYYDFLTASRLMFGILEHFAQTQSYFSKELTMNLIVTRRMTGLAALLASILMAACDLRSTNSSTETLTVYQDAPNMKLLDLGEPGNSPGDGFRFFAPLHYT